MALFNKKPVVKKAATKTDAVRAKVAKAEKADKKDEIMAIEKKDASVVQKAGGLELNMILLRPHITEKATDLSEKNVYAFEIARGANKAQVRQAVEKFYKVKPVKIAIIMGIAKYMKNRRTGRMQTKKTAIKKALVYLKKGDKIEFV
ncbi:MAG: 50S ribosomal protein L23 [Parcubacteria group bacterium GW2011_GWA2_47_7]|nr:MAG: 50S ribosomal protein L23 [Parcubacteria group bacterium GW2011_GWA2_47_7]